MSKLIKWLLLATMMIFTFTTIAFAGGDVDLNGVLKGATNNKAKVGDTIYVEMSDLDTVYGDFSTKYGQDKVGAEWMIGSNAEEAILQSGKFSYTIKSSDAGKEIFFSTYTKESDTHYNNNTSSITVESTGGQGKGKIEYVTLDKKGVLTVKGEAKDGLTFEYLYVDDKEEKWIGTKSFQVTIDTLKYKIGYHEVKAKLSDGSVIYAATVFPTNIYDKPVIKKNENFFSTGYNYICFRPYFTVPETYDGIYIQYKTGNKWGSVYGPFSSYEILKTNYFTGSKSNHGIKIKANTTYKARAFFAKKTSYGGNTYYITGPYSNEITLKTGKGAKPAVKSIKISKAKQKKKHLSGYGYWDAGGVYHYTKPCYVYSTTYKVTVKLKKKPGTSGIYIGKKKVKGNKKTYTATFTDSGKLKEKKIKVDVCSYNDAGTGAYSPIYSKKVKVK